MTSHPKDLSDRLIHAIRDLGSVCPQLHLPVQSGSAAVLKRMNRGYGPGHYLDLVRKIRGATPDITLTTDVIVGFPGESEDDFTDTLGLVEEAGFDLAYTFLFSPREGTAAAGYPDRVPADVAKERFGRLLALQNGISLRKNKAAVGSSVRLLCEGASKTNAERYMGRTPGGKVVNFRVGREPDHAGGTCGARGAGVEMPGGAVGAGCGLAGRYVDVLIEGAGTWSLDGVAIGVE
jgi:tRNA-2-methylthio-N6-dimethylallyladenosine synthase